jgi:hypothetical protein
MLNHLTRAIDSEQRSALRMDVRRRAGPRHGYRSGRGKGARAARRSHFKGGGHEGGPAYEK